MIDSLLKVADIFLGRADRLREAQADTRMRVSSYFENVARCLSTIAGTLKAKTEPRQACAELDEYSDQYNDYDDPESPIAKVFGERLAKELRGELWHLTDSRGGAVAAISNMPRHRFMLSDEYAHLPDDQILEVAIREIERAAGKFKALSVLAATQ